MRRPIVVAVTVPVSPALDLSAAVLGARRPDDRFFCLEQPDRARFCLATLGAASLVEAAGPERFSAVAAACRRIVADALVDDLADDPRAPSASGAVWVGGFAFADDGGGEPQWSSLAPAQLVLPELALARGGEQARLTLTAVVRAGDEPAAVIERLDVRLGELRPATIEAPERHSAAGAEPPESHSAAETRAAGAEPPEHYERAVRAAVKRIAAGELEKVVLAREVRVERSSPFDPSDLLGALRAAFPACYCFCVGTPELAFLGASPELLVRREGSRASSVALAGTTARSADPALDAALGERLRRSPKNLEEQAIVAARIERALAPVSVWVSRPPEPVVIQVRNAQHLATPIRAQLAEPRSVLELAELLHPTPAVGGEPWRRAGPLIAELEGLDRGWYAGPLGWMDLAEDGELCVALRCALLRRSVAHLYAGDGIVRDSVPAEELAETEVKLQALLPLLA